MLERKLEIIPLSEWGLFTDPRLSVIAGPCSAESQEQVLSVAKELSAIGINVFRAGIWKPRTLPGGFEGAGPSGLEWLKKAKEIYGLKMTTEVANKEHVFEALKHNIDLLWIGARTTANPFMVQEIADALENVDIPVLVKNPVSPDLELWIGALERLNKANIKKLGVIHRGCTTFEKQKYRNSPEWQLAIELRSCFPNLPFFCDPSHMAGDKKYIPEISQRSLDLGFEGLMIESHSNPSCALSDSKQQLTPKELEDLLSNKLVVRDSITTNSSYNEIIEQLRAEIDVIDENILSALNARMKISKQIGEQKKLNNIAILQTSRWDEILKKVVSKGVDLGLSENLVSNVFNAIHEASVELQNDIISTSSNSETNSKNPDI